MTKAMEILNNRREELGYELTTQMGRPIAYTAKEIDTMQIRAKYLIRIAEGALEDIPCEAESGFRRFVRKVPIGPTLIMFAWNVRLYRKIDTIIG